MKNNLLSIRLNPSQRAVLDKATADKNIPSSTFARSLVISAIENDLQIKPIQASLTPELDKLDPRVKFAILKPFEILASALRLGGSDEFEIEKALLFGVASSESELVNELAEELRIANSGNH